MTNPKTTNPKAVPLLVLAVALAVATVPPPARAQLLPGEEGQAGADPPLSAAPRPPQARSSPEAAGETPYLMYAYEDECGFFVLLDFGVIRTTVPIFQIVVPCPPTPRIRVAVSPSTTAKAASALPRGAADPDRLLVAFMTAPASGTFVIEARLFDGDGTPRGVYESDPIALPPGLPFHPAPDVAAVVFPDGRALLVWSQPNATSGTFDLTGQVIDAVVGLAVGDPFLIGFGTEPAAERLGDDRVALVDTDWFAGGTNLRILDLGGIDPVVGPRVVVDHSATTRTPTVAVDSVNGRLAVAYELVTGGSFDPTDTFLRFFDLDGTPLGEKHVAAQTTVGAQGHPALTFLADGTLAVAFATDAFAGPDNPLDVAVRLFDPDGPRSDEVIAHTTTTGTQDNPTLAVLDGSAPSPTTFTPKGAAPPEEELLVLWRDLDPTGVPNGSGYGYRRLGVDLRPAEIFADGFESGDTSAW